MGYYYSRKAECYDTKQNTFVDLPDMNIERKSHGMCALKNYLYVFCGVYQYENHLSNR